MAEVVATGVEHLTQVGAEDLPGWLNTLGLPAGWRTARIEAQVVQPSRIAVRGNRPDGRWDGCETITVFEFTGLPPLEDVRNTADCTLRALNAENITSHVLATPPIPGVLAMRSSGYFGVAGQPVWAQVSSFIAASSLPGEGLLISHEIFVATSCLADLSDDISLLSNSLHNAFVTTVATR